MGGYGRVMLNGDGRFVYTGSGGVNGSDEFEVVVENDEGDEGIG